MVLEGREDLVKWEHREGFQRRKEKVNKKGTGSAYVLVQILDYVLHSVPRCFYVFVFFHFESSDSLHTKWGNIILSLPY